MIQNYFVRLQAVVDLYVATNFVLEAKLNFETRSGDQAYLTGRMTFIDGSTLHFSEYLDQMGNNVDKLMYTYHYQDKNNHLVFRYDNARHKPPLSSLEHKHLPDKIVEAPAPTFNDVLTEIVTLKRWVQ